MDYHLRPLNTITYIKRDIASETHLYDQNNIDFSTCNMQSANSNNGDVSLLIVVLLNNLSLIFVRCNTINNNMMSNIVVSVIINCDNTNKEKNWQA